MAQEAETTLNGNSNNVSSVTSNRSRDLSTLVDTIKPLLLDFIDRSSAESSDRSTKPINSLVDSKSPEELSKLLNLQLSKTGQGLDGLVELTEKVLRYSVNTWHQGFLSKLYASPDPVGVMAELVLAVLNTNVHVYQVSPVLTTIEREVGKRLAQLFGLNGETAGGLVQQGGSGANLTALVVARNAIFPGIKCDGFSSKRLVLFTSKHSHYSLEKAAQICGLGTKAVWKIEVNKDGQMSVDDLKKKIAEARVRGFQPFFVNATAGTTVLGSYDPLSEIAKVCRDESLWMHIDACWGGAVAFSENLQYKLRGAELADTISYNPHKMLNMPLTCSFLLVADMTKAWESNTLPANYLFHNETSQDAAQMPDDLADMTLQCGRRGDALKLALSWNYYGTAGFQTKIDTAFDTANVFANLVDRSPNLFLVSTSPPPCLQVCSYFAPGKRLLSDVENTSNTRRIAHHLLREDYLVDFAPGEHGHLLRVVVNLETNVATVQDLVTRIERIGSSLS